MAPVELNVRSHAVCLYTAFSPPPPLPHNARIFVYARVFAGFVGRDLGVRGVLSDV